jgi:enoyl-CoA hydratase
MQTHIFLEERGDIGYLTFACDQPGKPATLDHHALDEFAAKLEEVESRMRDLRALVVQSNSERYFIVGANINALRTLDAETIIPWVRHGHVVFNQLESLPIPVIASVEGYALGGGLELALACDLIVASRNSMLGQPEARLGLVAGWGGSHRLPRRIGLARAKELFFTGKLVEAEEALKIGLVDFVGDSSDIHSHLESLFEGIRLCSPLAVSQMKKLVNNSPNITIQEGGLEEAAASSICFSSDDTKMRVAGYLEKNRKRVDSDG